MHLPIPKLASPAMPAIPLIFTLKVQDVSELGIGAKPGAQISTAVRLVLRCIMGQLVGCYGDLAGSELSVFHEHRSDSLLFCQQYLEGKPAMAAILVVNDTSTELAPKLSDKPFLA
ncbi:hypothetical protein XENOCAPTIV_019469 [Xenoophorus captivus]|uniref:Uncharacterized protein n=1 Tax=Xenoophorus captivus TaxID=1517983 RepID=A0ABV0R9L6_9TELE